MPQKTLSFLRHKKKLDSYLSQLLKEKQTEFSVHPFSYALFEYLETFVQSGKSVRGSLFLEAILEFDAEAKVETYLPVAAAIELIHSALLIQDDFMDQDDARRGTPALHSVEYKQAQQQLYRRPGVYAPSAVMCATDIVFFLAFEQMNAVLCGKNQVWQFIANEYSHVGFAQWQDVVFAHEQPNGNKLSEIENVYKYKTARYTFVMPVVVAGLVAGVHENTLKKLEQMLEAIGMIFQIRDDYLSLFGNEEITGKPVGGDVIENKKTMYRYYFFKALGQLSKSERDELKSLYGKHALTQFEVHRLQKMHQELGVLNTMQKKIDTYKKSIMSRLDSLDVSDSFKSQLLALTTFVSERDT